MKILYLSTNDIDGGAAKGAYRLHHGFIENNINSTMMVARKLSDNPSIITPTVSESRWWWLRTNIASRILALQHSSNPIFHSINFLPSGLVTKINGFGADIVQLHWIGKEFLSISDVAQIDAPIVWRLADQWAFCGAEHYTLPDQESRFRQGYWKNNRPPRHFGIDIDRWTWNRKIKYWHDKPMTIVTGSRWLADCAKESVLFADKRIEVIPSGIDITVFKPIAKNIARNILNLPQTKKLILFGAISAMSDVRKGFHLLTSALKILTSMPDTENIEAVILGARRPEKVPEIGLPIHYIPTLRDEISLPLVYSSADVLVAPSTQDNLPFSVMEAQACGCPCVAFNIGGLPDLIEHESNGYLAQPFDPEDLAIGIAKILTNDSLLDKWGNASRIKAEQEYDVNIQVSRYLRIYKDILSKKH